MLERRALGKPHCCLSGQHKVERRQAVADHVRERVERHGERLGPHARHLDQVVHRRPRPLLPDVRRRDGDEAQHLGGDCLGVEPRDLLVLG